MARNAVGKTVCPISKMELAYSGRGRPPIYHPNISKAVRRAWASGRKVRQDASGVYHVVAASR